eukprot:392167-Alexandrium_andersonii.AAC.1
MIGTDAAQNTGVFGGVPFKAANANGMVGSVCQLLGGIVRLVRPPISHCTPKQSSPRKPPSDRR